MGKVRVVHYMNQFFAGIGGEESANEGPGVKESPIGPGRALLRALGNDGDLVATVYCGDNYINENPDIGIDRVLEYVSRYRPDVVVAGPAFNAGRYGLACGLVCTAVQERLNVPTVTGMYRENPAVDLYRAQLYIVPTGITASAMVEALSRMAALALRLARGERIGTPTDEGYIPRGLRFTERASARAAARAVAMLLKRVNGQEFQTEWPLPSYDRAIPPPAVKDLSKATVALVTTGGIVPQHNPDRIESSFATKWLKYDVSQVVDLSAEQWQSIHGGFDSTYANEDPDRIVPLDAVRDFESTARIGRLFEHLYVTVGSSAGIASAKKFGREIASDLVAAKVDGVLITST